MGCVGSQPKTAAPEAPTAPAPAEQKATTETMADSRSTSAEGAPVTSAEGAPVTARFEEELAEPASKQDGPQRDSAQLPAALQARWITSDGTDEMLTADEVLALTFRGVLNGLAEKHPDGMYTGNCQKDPVIPAVDLSEVDVTAAVACFEAAVVDFEANTLDESLRGLQHVSRGLETLVQALSSGASAGKDDERYVRQLTRAIDQLRTPKDASFMEGEQLSVCGIDILAWVYGAIGNFHDSEWERFGTNVAGIVCALVPPTTPTPQP